MKTEELTQMLSNPNTFPGFKQQQCSHSPLVALHAAKDSFVDNVKS